MSSNSRRYLAGLLAVTLSACATSPAPRGWLPTPREIQHEALGGWIDLKYGPVKQPMRVEGELIAVSADRLYVLTGSGLKEVPQVAVTEARLAAYRTGRTEIGAWFGLGSASTLSHGYFLVFTLPMWLIAGGVVLGGESRAGQLSYPNTPLARFSLYARFPQGLPPDLDPAELGTLTPAGRTPPRQ